MLCYDQGLISDEEFLLLLDFYKSFNLSFPYYSYPPFEPEELEDHECLAEFCVRKRDITLLAEALQIPDWIVCSQRRKAEGTEALCMLLKRFVYPTRYSDMIPRFSRPVPVLSMVTNELLDQIYALHSHRIITWNPTILDPPSLERYAQAISVRGSPLQNCFGFIDGTVRLIARPDKHQRIVYKKKGGFTP